jgi:hypothetical protein
MVTFCQKCHASLPPEAELLIKQGKEFPSPYYTCPTCGKLAGEEAETTTVPPTTKPPQPSVPSSGDKLEIKG